MAIDLNTLKRGRRISPPIMTVYAPEGFGKSTLASETNNPLCLACEDPGPIDITYYPTEAHGKPTFDEAIDFLDTVANTSHPYKTIVIDTITSLEQIVHAKVAADAGVATVSDIGYQAGYKATYEIFNSFFEKLARIKEKGMVVLLLGHSAVRTFEPPHQEAYNEYTLSLYQGKNNNLSDLIMQKSDVVIFGDYKIHTKKEDKGFGKKRVIPVGTEADRIAYTAKRPGIHAKNRYAMPSEMEWDYNLWMNHINGFLKSKGGNDKEKAA